MYLNLNDFQKESRTSFKMFIDQAQKLIMS